MKKQPDPLKADLAEMKELFKSAHEVLEQREHSSYCMMVTARNPAWIHSNKFCDCIRRINLGVLGGLSALYGESPDECRLDVGKEVRHFLKMLTAEHQPEEP